MFLALKEMARAKVRFALLIAAIALLVFLILFQQSLQNGLITGFIGAIRNQSAPVLVYSVDGQRTVQGSIITPDLDAQVRAAPVSARSARSGKERSPVNPNAATATPTTRRCSATNSARTARDWRSRRRSSRGDSRRRTSRVWRAPPTSSSDTASAT